MSHTQCDARQRSRFELLSSEQWGHRGAGGINLLAYNTASLINGGSGEHSLKNATLSNSSIECCEKNNVLPDSGERDNGQGWVVSTVILFYWKLFPFKQKDSCALFLSFRRIVRAQNLLQFHPLQAPPTFYSTLHPLPVHPSPFSIKSQLTALMYPDRVCHLTAN